MAYAVEMLDICKYFPGVRANDHVNFKVREGEIHGLLGENGAGKSTLMNVLFGLFQADSGTIMINGEEKVIDSPKKAIDMGIEMIHQHFMLVGNLTVAENIILGEEPTGKFNILDRTEIAKKVSDLLERIGFRLELGDMIEDISVGLQQRVEILKALYREARILILDEPTAVLTPQEADELFETIKRLKSEGVTIIFITHKLREIIAICDRVTVLRHGKVIGTVNTSETTRSNLANMMVGREVLFKIDKKAVSPGKVILDVENVTALDDRHLRALNNISFNVREGEIVGIAGVQGNGQSQLIEVITGLRAAKTGKIIIDGITTTDFSPRKVLEEGVAHIPEDRQSGGSFFLFQ
ncbi:MAG: ABC transporter ATP-binding protein [Candidatus Odinarchaeota archaeon]